MICRNCEVAGYLNQDANDYAALGRPGLAESIRVMSRQWHRECKTRDCPCQHVIGEVMARRRAPEVRDAEE